MAAKKFAAYMRVSRIGGRSGDSYISLADQRERIERYISMMGEDIVIPEDGWYTDEDFSGGNTDRPAFQDVVSHIEAGDFDGLAVVRIDRFSRDVMDGVEWVGRILKAGGTFASATEQLNFSEDIGHYMLVQFLNNAELQLRMLKRQWKGSKERAVARGAHIGPTPFGYQRVPKGSPARSGCLDPHPVQAPAVFTAYEMRKDGKTYADIAQWLDAVAPPVRGPKWSITSVKRMLSQRVYLGEVHYRSRVGEADLVKLDAHMPLVTRPLFDAVQGLQTTGPKKEARRDYVLRGLVRCAHCRSSMGGFTRGDTGVYRCPDRSRRCAGRPVITAEGIEHYVIDAFWTAMAAERGRQAGSVAPDHADRLDELAAELVDVKAELVRLSSREARKRFSADVREQKEQQLLDEQAAIEDEQAQLERDLNRHEAGVYTFRREDVTRDQLPTLMRQLVKYVFVRSGRAPLAERVMVVLADGPDFDVPRRGVTGNYSPISWPDDDAPALAAS
jgi:site-specific DNA recombinase